MHKELEKLSPHGSKLPKHTVPELDEILGLQFPVLDHGFVRVVDYMGSDDSIVQAARVSYGGGTTQARSDRNLIRYLVRHQHSSPLEMCEIKLHIKLPIFVARQFIRHRTASVNELSGRYSIMEHEFYLPSEEDLNLQSTSNRQGRSDDTLAPEDMDRVLSGMKAEALDIFQNYESYINAGIAKEVGRINLPLSTYTQWYWKIDLRNLLHFINLRNSSHAQLEIRKYAEVIAALVQVWCPATHGAFNDYVVEGLHLTQQDRIVLQKLLQRYSNLQHAERAENVLDDEMHDLSPGERGEILAKMQLLGFDFTSAADVAPSENKDKIVERMQSLRNRLTADESPSGDGLT